MPSSGNDLHPKIRNPREVEPRKAEKWWEGFRRSGFLLGRWYIYFEGRAVHFQGCRNLGLPIVSEKFPEQPWPSVRYDTNNDVSIPPPHEIWYLREKPVILFCHFVKEIWSQGLFPTCSLAKCEHTYACRFICFSTQDLESQNTNNKKKHSGKKELGSFWKKSQTVFFLNLLTKKHLLK